MFEASLYILQKKLPQMVERGLTRASCHCKACGGRNTVIINRAKNPGPRGQVVRWHCTQEGCGNRGMT